MKIARQRVVAAAAAGSSQTPPSVKKMGRGARRLSQMPERPTPKNGGAARREEQGLEGSKHGRRASRATRGYFLIPMVMLVGGKREHHSVRS